jgi:hypothetical protein
MRRHDQVHRAADQDDVRAGSAATLEAGAFKGAYELSPRYNGEFGTHDSAPLLGCR